MAETPTPRRERPRWLSVLLGTAPGLEVFLFAALPAVAATGIAIAIAHTSRSVAFLIGLAVLVIAIALTRRAFR